MFINPPQNLTPSTAFNGSSTTSESDILPLTALIAVKIYAFGGLAFMIGVVLFALGLWVWTVVIKREWANSPPELELHPERMRERERARQERLKRKKEEKLKKRGSDDCEKKFTPPPIRLNEKECSQKARKSSFSSTTSTLRSPNRCSSSLSTKNYKPKPIERKSSFSAGSPKKGLRVSWASSASTVDVNGHASEKSLAIETESKTSSLPSIKFPFDTKSIASSIDTPLPIPRARTSIPRLSTSIGERAPRGEEMIAATTPDICESWSKPTDPSLICRCWDSVDPQETEFPRCNIHLGRK